MTKSWSFSKLTRYEKCPHSISFPYEAYTPNEHAQRGIDIHAQCEQYILHGGEEPTPGFPWERLHEAKPEIKLGLDSNWHQVNYNEAWLKFIIDALIITPNNITIIDFKTGKREYSDVKYTMQLQLYAAAMASIYPDIELINTELWYLDEGHTGQKTYTREKLNPLRERLNNRAVKMLNDTKLDPHPSKSSCRFCQYNQKCEFAHESLC